MKRILAVSGSLALGLVAGLAAADTAPESPPPRPVVVPAPQETVSVPMPPERIVWDRTPLGVMLPVGQERQVTFPAPVEVGMPAGLADVVRTQVVAGTVYWLAKKDFTPQRIQVRDTATGQIYLVDLSARASASTAPVIIALAPTDPTSAAFGLAGGSVGAAAGAAGRVAESAPPAPPRIPTYDYAALTRFAAQSLYAPRRLTPALPGVFRTPVDERALDLVRGESIQATPLIAWRSGNLHITAVRLRNRGASSVILDPRALRGLWLAATFQHARLLPHGDEADTSAVYLISAKPFEQAVQGIY